MPSSSVHGVHPLSNTFSALVTAFALLGASENDIGEDDDGDVIVFGVPFATSPASPPRSARSSGGDAGGRCCCCYFESGSGIARHVGDLLQLPLSSPSSELNASCAFLLLFAPLLFAKLDRTCAALIALRQHACGSKFSRRPQKSCSVGAAKLVSHACDRARSTVSRRAGLGW